MCASGLSKEVPSPLLTAAAPFFVCCLRPLPVLQCLVFKTTQAIDLRRLERLNALVLTLAAMGPAAPVLPLESTPSAPTPTSGGGGAGGGGTPGGGKREAAPSGGSHKRQARGSGRK